MIEGILAEWFASQTEEARTAYFTNGVAHASMETMRAQMTHLYEALKAEGLHEYHCRRVINRMLYGTAEPPGIKTFAQRLIMLQPTAFTMSGQLVSNGAAQALIDELSKIEGFDEEPLQVQQD